MPFIRENCDYCGDCLTSCQYIDMSQEEAVAQIKNLVEKGESRVLQECFTCYACNEYCPKNANPFDLIAELQAKKNSLCIAAKAQETLATVYGTGDYTGSTEGSGPLMLQCHYHESNPEFFEGAMFKGLTLARGRELRCNLIFLHTGQYDFIKRDIGTIVANIAKFGANEVICFHDECYATYSLYAPQFGVELPFKPIHIFEYLVDFLKKNPEMITPLNMKIAYQRSCSSRLTPGKEHFLDELFELIGVERVKRTYDHQNALCCQAPGLMVNFVDREKADSRIIQTKSDGIGKYQTMNIDDALQAGATALISVCPICHKSLSVKAKESGIAPIFITQLVRMALGELPKP